MAYHHVEKEAVAAGLQNSPALVRLSSEILHNKWTRNALSAIERISRSANVQDWDEWKININKRIAEPSTNHKWRKAYQRVLELLNDFINDPLVPQPADLQKVCEAISICTVAQSIIEESSADRIPQLTFHRLVIDSDGKSVLSTWGDYESSQFNDIDHEIDIAEDFPEHVKLIEVKRGYALEFRQLAKYYFVSVVCDWYRYSKPEIATRGRERLLKAKVKELLDEVRRTGDPLSFNENDFTYNALNHKI